MVKLTIYLLGSCKNVAWDLCSYLILLVFLIFIICVIPNFTPVLLGINCTPTLPIPISSAKTVMSNTVDNASLYIPLVLSAIILSFHLFNVVLSSVSYIPLNINLSIVRKTRTNSDISKLEPLMLFLLFYYLYDPVIILLHILDLFQFLCPRFSMLFTKHANHIIPLIKIISFISLYIRMFLLLPSWLIFIRIILSNDIETNPGDLRQGFFTFCNWNLNSLAKDNFHRVRLLEAHNSIFDYDIISICETALNDDIELPEKLMEEFTFIPSHSPYVTRRGGVGLFYKNTLPLKLRDDLSFDECIVVKLKFGRKNIFFTVTYRSPSFTHGSLQYISFLTNFESLYEKIKKENPYCMYFAGDYNCHSQIWYNGQNTDAEGREFEELSSMLGLTQLINEPTNFEPNKKPTCIDLIFTDQPNLVIESGTRPSLDTFCHHQIIYCRINFLIPPAPSFDRKIWHFNRANTPSIQRAISNFPWREHLNSKQDSNWQAETFTDIILNIMSNFIPNETIRIKPKDPPWIKKQIKTMLNKQNRMYKNFKKNGYKTEDKIRLDNFRDECYKAISLAKERYLSSMGQDLANPSTSKRTYWKIINRVMNKCKAPKIPPMLSENEFVINCKEKADLFANYFSLQCKPLDNDSVLPGITYHTENQLDHITITSEEILSQIRNLNKGKSCGPDNLSAHMLLLCNDTIVLPLTIIYQQILSSGIFPQIWKLANVTPIHKKGNKQVVTHYRPRSLLPICGKILKK